jgi:hypothetical protein
MHICMRTTIDMNDELLRLAKNRAVREGITFRQLLENALRSHLAPLAGKRTYKFQWRTEKGRLQAGVQLDDRDSLFDFMDGRR